MASLEDCDQALRGLAERLAGVDADTRRRYVVARTLACRLPDLGVVFLGRLDEHGLQEIRCVQTLDKGDAQVRLAANSDDLLALIDGTLPVPGAWASGRLKVEASVLDLLKLRSLL